MAAKAYPPVRSLVVVFTGPAPLSVIFAEGTAAPLGSVIVPRRLAVWAKPACAYVSAVTIPKQKRLNGKPQDSQIDMNAR